MMTTFLNLYCILFILYIYRTSTVPISTVDTSNEGCSSAKLIGYDQEPLIYQYRTEVILSVANNQFDLKTEITASVQIKSIGDCNYALQLRDVKVTETKDTVDQSVALTANAQRELENCVVRFRWINGFVVAIEADSSTKIDHINFVKGVLSALQVYSPVSTNNELVTREEDVLGVCTTVYKYTQTNNITQIKKSKDLSTCSKDKLHLSSSPVLTSLLGPIMEEAFTAKTRYLCQTEVRNKKIQSVKCKTIEMNTDDSKKSTKKSTSQAGNNDVPINTDDDSSEVDFDIDFNAAEETSSKLISITQELKLQQSSGSVSIDENSIVNPILQTLQFTPTASFDQSNEVVSKLVTKIQALLKTEDWNEFAAAQFVEITNELRRMDKVNLQEFKTKSELKHLIPAFLNTVYAHDPVASLLNFDLDTLTFSNPSSVYYLENPSTELVDQVVLGASRLTAEQVPDFVGIASKILYSYKARQDNNKHADAKIKEFHQAISRFLDNPSNSNTDVTTTVLSAYAKLALYDDKLQKLTISDTAPLEVQYHALNVIRHLNVDDLTFDSSYFITFDLRSSLIDKLQNTANKNAVRIWAFQTLLSLDKRTKYSMFGTSRLETVLANILDEPINQVNSFIWSALQYVSLDPLHALQVISARLRVNCKNKDEYVNQAVLFSRQIQFELPLRKNYRAFVDASVIFENDRFVPSFISVKLAFDGVRRETLRLPWIDAAMIIENLDWNFADYLLRLDPLSKKLNEDEKARLKNNLPPRVKESQDTYDSEEDPDPSVHLHLKLFGTNVRTKDITEKVQDILRSDLNQFIGEQIFSHLNKLVGQDPIFRIPFEISSASAAANGLTLYKSAQVSILADLTTDVRATLDSSGMGTFSMTSRSALSFALTMQREVSSPLTTVGETVELGILSYVPFQYKTEVNSQGHTREFNILKPNAKLLAIDFKYGTRTSNGFEISEVRKTPTIDPSCTPSALYRTLGAQICLQLNPFRSIQLGSRTLYPITISVNRDPSIKNWRLGWRFNAQEAPQYELAIAKVGVTQSYPGLGISVNKDGNKFDVKILTGMKFFNVKGTQTGDVFSGSVYSNDEKEILTTTGTLTMNNDGLKMESQFFDISSNKEVLILVTNILPNRDQGLTADFSLTTPDKAKSLKLQFRGDLYKPNSKLLHINGGFNLGQTSYDGKLVFELDENHTRFEIQRLTNLNQDSSAAGYELFYEHKFSKETAQNNLNIASHISLRTPTRNESMKVFNFKTDFTRSMDLSNTTVQSSLDYVLLTRNPPVHETIEFDYVKRLTPTNNTVQDSTLREEDFKVQIKTKSNVLNFLCNHRFRMDFERSKERPVMEIPTLVMNNKMHFVVDTDKLFPDIPRQLSFDILSDMDFQLFKELNYKFEYSIPTHQLSGLLKYHNQIDNITFGIGLTGTSKLELQWDNKQKQATCVGNFDIELQSNTLKLHWDIDTNLIQDKNDMTLDVNLQFNIPYQYPLYQLSVSYDIKLKAPKHTRFQLIGINGSLTQEFDKFETLNSIAIRMNESLKEININALYYENSFYDEKKSLHISFSLPFKYLPYIKYDLEWQLSDRHDKSVKSQLFAKPVFSHYCGWKFDRFSGDLSLQNEFEYLRSNGDSLYGTSKIEALIGKSFHSFGSLKRNTDLLHKHSIGTLFSSKTAKLALSLISPQISANPLSIIGEYTLDRENVIGIMRIPQKFVIHFEFGTPISKLIAFRIYYDLSLFSRSQPSAFDGSVGFKIASPTFEPISFHFRSTELLDKQIKLVNGLRLGNNIAMSSSLTVRYDPRTVSQISMSTNAKFYGKEFQHSCYALFKQHQAIIRGIVNKTNDQDYQYEIDIGYDDDLFTGHGEKTNGNEVTVSDIDCKKCIPTDKYYRCYKGNITVRAGANSLESKGTFDISWGPESAKLDIKVPNHIEFSFDHTHTNDLSAGSLNSKMTIDGKMLQTNNRGGFSYSHSIDIGDERYFDLQIQSSLNDGQTGRKLLAADIRSNQTITDKHTGQVQRKFNINLERLSLPIFIWSSDSLSCSENPVNTIYGSCQTQTFDIKVNNLIVQRIRQYFQLPNDSRLSDPHGQISYDGTLNLDIKHDPTLGPHTIKLNLNRFKENAIDFDLSVEQTLNLSLTLNPPQQNPISFKYNEILDLENKMINTIKYSFDANDNTAEKTYQCERNFPPINDFRVYCKGETTALNIDINILVGKMKFLVDLNRLKDERIGFECAVDPYSLFNMTIYTFVTSWNLEKKYMDGFIFNVKQNNQEVFRIDEIASPNDYSQRIWKFSPSNIELRFNTGFRLFGIEIKQINPQQRDILKASLDFQRIMQYKISTTNLNIPSYDIEKTSPESDEPLFMLSLDSHTLLVSQDLGKIGSYHGIYGLSTIKKLFQLQIGDANLTVYNIQHWKTHLTNVKLLESYSFRIVNDANGNNVELATNKWNENRLISTISHSFDGGKTQTIDLKIDHNYALQVGSVYFFHGSGYRNIKGFKQFKNSTRQFIHDHLIKGLNKTNLAELLRLYQKSMQSLLEIDYACVKEIVNQWSKESQNSFFKKLNDYFGLLEFFNKYPTYTELSNRIYAILCENVIRREEFWRNRIEAILNNNRLFDVSKTLQTHRLKAIKYLLGVSGKFFDRILPKLNQKKINERIETFVQKTVSSFEQLVRRNAEQWKIVFKAIDDASKGEENQWFRQLIADIDSRAVAAVADAELTKVFKKLGGSSKLLINNIQKVSQRINKRRESIQEGVENVIRHFPKASINETNFEVLLPEGDQPRSYTDATKLLMTIEYLITTGSNTIEGIRSLILNSFRTRTETYQRRLKFIGSLMKHQFKRDSLLSQGLEAVIFHKGFAVDFHNKYIYLNTSCHYVLAHDFDGLQFSFRFIRGKVYSALPNLVEIKENECSNTGRVRLCNLGSHSTLNMPMYYGGRVNGVFGDVRKSDNRKYKDTDDWLAFDCSAAKHQQSKRNAPLVSECNEQELGENFVQCGIKSGPDQW